MSELDADLLVRRTRLLLRAYPKAYRAHRGEEILDTLLETTRPGRGWPPAREVASVISGGLRARRAANLSQGLGASLRHSVMLGAALWLITVPEGTATLAIEAVRHVPVISDTPQWVFVLTSVMVLLILAAAWSGRRWLALAAAVASAVPLTIYWLNGGTGFAEWLGLYYLKIYVAPATLLLVLLARRTNRPSRSLLWLLVCPLLAGTADALLSTPGHQQYLLGPIAQATTLMSPYDTVPSLITVAVAACWLITDIRPLAGIAISFTAIRLFYDFLGAPNLDLSRC